MKKSIFKNNILLNMINSSLIKLPTPINISMWWNMGSMLGLCLMIQIISGLILTMHYCPNVNQAFNSIIHITQNVKYGWLIHNIHMNGASLYFMCMYMHIGRNIYYMSYKYNKVWIVGTMIMLMSMATAFLGYVLPWGQMSFWGATVITNLLSAIPYIGNSIVIWLWGGFSINNATLNRFYTFHFIMPFLIMMLVIIHLMFLHEFGSNNPLGLNSNLYKIYFHPMYTIKDSMGFMILFMMLIMLMLQYPYYLSDPDNFINANPMITPIHIKPEWYFLFAYAILRSIPNKLGGVIALMLSILILLILPFLNKSMMNSNKFYPINQIYYWMFILTFFLLTWTGGKPIEYPFMLISQISTWIYFSYFLINSMIYNYWDKLIYI